ncbi:MAG: AI-2E family transporter [Gemmatimonadales bacterium]
MPSTGASPAWRSRDVLRVTALVAGVYLVLRLLWVGQEIVFLAFIGVLFGLTLSAAADKVGRFGIPRAVAAPAILLLVLGAIFGLGTIAAPQVAGQLREVQSQVPQVIGKVRGWVEAKAGGVTEMLSDSVAAPKVTAAKAAGPSTPSAGSELTPQISTVGHAFFTVFSSTLAAVGGAILVLFITLFVAIDPDLYQRGVMHLFPHRTRSRAREVFSAVAFALRRWLVTQFIAMVVIGLVTGGVLSLLGIRGAIALGIIAGLLEFIPFVGPIVAAVPAIAMGLLDSPEKAITVAVVFTVIQQAEGHLLIPLLMKDSLSLPPVLTILNQALMATVFGFLGLLVAVPLLATVMVPVKLLYVEDVVGDEVDVPGANGETST